MDFVANFREKIGMLENLLADGNFRACANMSTDLLRAAEFAGFTEGVYLGEFFEALFSNMRQLIGMYNLDKKDIENVQRVSLPVVQFFKTNLPLTDANKKAELYDLMMKARFAVTQLQITTWRDKKSRRPPISIPETIQFET
jgi:hypothetical protein